MKKNTTALEEIYNENRFDFFAMSVANLLDIGFRNAVKITDEEIKELEGNGIMTQEFVQDLVRLTRDIAKACDTVTEIISFCDKHEVFGCGDISRKRLKDILCSYVINDAETADMSYIRDVLYDCCGCYDDELRAIGLDWAICEDYYDDEEELRAVDLDRSICEDYYEED